MFTGVLREIKGVVDLDGRTRAMVNEDDAASSGISDGDEIEVITRSGALAAVAQICEYVPTGFIQLAIPHTDTLVQSLNRPPSDVVPRNGARARVVKLAAVVG